MLNRFFLWLGVTVGGFASFLALATEIGAVLWNVHLHAQLDIGPNGLGGGLAAILTASAALLAAPPAARAMLTHQQVKLARLEKNDAK